MACADTTLLLDLSGRGGAALKRRAEAVARRLWSSGETLFVTRFSLAELFIGVYKVRDPRREEQRVRELLRGVVVLPFDEAAARQFGRITAHLQRIGQPVGDMDVLIAATAMVAGERLITRDALHFRNIPGLMLEEY